MADLLPCAQPSSPRPQCRRDEVERASSERRASVERALSEREVEETSMSSRVISSLPPSQPTHPPTPTPGAREGVKERREGREGRRVRWLGMGRGAASRGSPRAARRACKVAESERRVKNCTCMLLASQLASAWKIVSRRDEIVRASTPTRSSKKRLKNDMRRPRGC